MLTLGQKGGKDEKDGPREQLHLLHATFPCHSMGMQAAALIHAKGVQSKPFTETMYDKNWQEG